MMRTEIKAHDCLRDAPAETPLEVTQVVLMHKEEDPAANWVEVTLHRVRCLQFRASLPQVRQ